MNSVNLIGRFTKDPVLKKTNTDKSVTQFTLAVSRDKDSADFINCVAWNKSAELISQYFHKGSQIGVAGRLSTRDYDDPNVPNKKVYVTEVIVDSITFIDKKEATKEVEKEPIYDSNYAMNITSDDLPF